MNGQAFFDLTVNQGDGPVAIQKDIEKEAARAEEVIEVFPYWGQLENWITENCDGCMKGFSNNKNEYKCEIEIALVDMLIRGQGEMKRRMAIRIGLEEGKTLDGITCKERVEI